MIQSLGIKDINTRTESKDLTGKKLILIDEIIEALAPVFSVELERKKNLLDSNKKDLSNLKAANEKLIRGLQTLEKQVKKEKLKNALLLEIKTLVGSDVLYGNRKQFIVSTLQNINTLDDQDLEKKLSLIKSLKPSNKNRVITNK